MLVYSIAFFANRDFIDMKFNLFTTVLATALLLVATTAKISTGKTTEPMPHERFWTIIEQSVQFQSDSYLQMEALKAHLKELPAEEIVAFDNALDREMTRAYSWELWGAAYLINGGASNDGFVYFRLWLVSKGRKIFEAALRNPDSLAESEAAAGPDGIYELEELMYVAPQAWTEKTGRDYGAFPAHGIGQVGQAPSGTDFDFEDQEEVAKRFPKLWKRFGANPLP